MHYLTLLIYFTIIFVLPSNGSRHEDQLATNYQNQKDFPFNLLANVIYNPLTNMIDDLNTQLSKCDALEMDSKKKALKKLIIKAHIKLIKDCSVYYPQNMFNHEIFITPSFYTLEEAGVFKEYRILIDDAKKYFELVYKYIGDDEIKLNYSKGNIEPVKVKLYLFDRSCFDLSKKNFTHI